MGKIFVIDHGNKLYPKVLALRQLVLRDPLGMKYSADELKRDRIMTYFAYINNDEVFGVIGLELMLNGRAQLRQMAVHGKLQGQGVGRKLVEFLEAYCGKQGFAKIHLDSRYEARGFYARLGYSEYGEIYEKIGLKHINMKKRL